MRNRINIGIVSLVLVCVMAAVAGIASPRTAGDTAGVAARLERRIASRLSKLEGYVSKEPRRLPQDMVIYRYDADTLVSWNGQFPVFDDDISDKVVFQRLVSPRVGMASPLAGIGPDMQFVNLGSKWYLIRAYESGREKVIAGLEIVNPDNPGSFNGINPRFRIDGRYSVRSLEYSGGSPVKVNGVPQFKVMYDSLAFSSGMDAFSLWLALLFFLVAVVVFLKASPTVPRLVASVAGVLLSCGGMFAWGRGAASSWTIFSPVIYADGDVLYSLGAVILINIALGMGVICLYLARRPLFLERRGRGSSIAAAVMLPLYGIVLVGYSFFALRSIALNSGITLELYKVSSLSAGTALVLFSFIGLLVCVPVLIYLAQPAYSRLIGRHINPWSLGLRVVYAVMVASFLVATTSILGFLREGRRVEGWGNRLSVERDISLEIQLRRVEVQIASDPVIVALASLPNSKSVLLSRIREVYLSGVSQDYEISLADTRLPFPDEEPLADNSRFFYSQTPDGRPMYKGYFTFYTGEGRQVWMTLAVETPSIRTGSSYAVLLGYSRPGTVTLPSEYSYAKYVDRDLQRFKGSYAYPTSLADREYVLFYSGRTSSTVIDGYRHFITIPTRSELVIISRPAFKIFQILTAGLFLAVVTFLILSLLCVGSIRKADLGQNFFRRNIRLIIMISLFLAMTLISLVSVLYVRGRGENNLRTSMADKITSIQSLVRTNLRTLGPGVEYSSKECLRVLEEVASNTNSDISLYSPQGLVMTTTVPEVFERMVLGIRIDPEAYDNIVVKNKGYYFHKERLRGRSYYAMYAPLFDPYGALAAIICVPGSGITPTFEQDVINHLLSVLVVFVALMLVARFAASAVVEKLLRPLRVMGHRMSFAGRGDMEHIEYGREDEVSALVNAYNRMVDDLKESTDKLAQAEREQAWSGMARQVAHEIKNPLTPMKLQIQRVARLKAKGDPAWADKFDEAALVLLDQIDILTDTADEFSSLARLVTEESTRIDLDALLREEILMFDNNERIEFDYIGLHGVFVTGPKPQLARVFVNLMTNAVQALGEDGGRIRVELRNSTEDGFYDIVVADSGPGVAEENVSRMFMPDFTTKTSGSGLGLAISRSILTRCGARIEYSRDYLLGGACFTVTYPKNADES